MKSRLGSNISAENASNIQNSLLCYYKLECFEVWSSDTCTARRMIHAQLFLAPEVVIRKEVNVNV